MWNNFLYSNESEDALFSREEETFHQTELAEILNKLKNEPLDINHSSSKMLKKLPWLSDNDIEKILDLRKNHFIRNKKSLIEIGINQVTIERILPYISFTRINNLKKYEDKFRMSYKEKTEEISSVKFYNSLKYTQGKFQFGFINQKDAGESNPLDFYSYYLYYQSPKSVLPKLIIGKYRLFFGQGICFAPKLGMSKSCEATNTPLKRGKMISPYSSTFEMWDLEGGAFILNYRDFSLIPFYSRTGIDANLKNDQITSFDYTGFHKTLKKKNSVLNKNRGAILNYSKENIDCGILINLENFDHDFSDNHYNKNNLYLSNQMNLHFKNYQFSSEISFANSKKAGIFVAKYSEDEYSNLILFRNYEQYFPSWHGHPFAAQSTNFGNEEGVYYGFSYFPNRLVKFDFYTDLWKFPNSRYLEKLPTFGSEIFGKFTILKKVNLVDFTFQRKLREKKSTLDEISKIRDVSRNLYRINFIKKLGKICNWKNRVEYVSEEIYEENKYKSGFLVYQQLEFKQKTSSVNFRITTTHGSVLHYVYENNVSGIMQNRICRGDNLFAFILLKTKLKKIFIQIKVGGSLIDQSSLESYFFLKRQF
jgi:hypothetical protein